MGVDIRNSGNHPHSHHTYPTEFAFSWNNCHSDVVFLKQLRDTGIGARVAVKQNGRSRQGDAQEKKRQKRKGNTLPAGKPGEQKGREQCGQKKTWPQKQTGLLWKTWERRKGGEGKGKFNWADCTWEGNENEMIGSNPTSGNTSPCLILRFFCFYFYPSLFLKVRSYAPLLSDVWNSSAGRDSPGSLKKVLYAQPFARIEGSSSTPMDASLTPYGISVSYVRVYRANYHFTTQPPPICQPRRYPNTVNSSWLLWLLVLSSFRGSL